MPYRRSWGLAGSRKRSLKGEGKRVLPSAFSLGGWLFQQRLVLDLEAAVLELFLAPLAAVFLDDAAVEEVNRPVGVTGVARIVGHHADGRPLFMQLAQQLHHRLAVLRVEVPGRLVGEQDRGRARDRARHRDALLLTAGELAGQVLGAMRHADLL